MSTKTLTISSTGLAKAVQHEAQRREHAEASLSTLAGIGRVLCQGLSETELKASATT